MTEAAVTYFNRAQRMLLDLHISINTQLEMQKGLENSRHSNEKTLALFEGVTDGGHRLDRTRMKLRGNLNGLETGEVLIGVAAGAILQIAKQALSMGYEDPLNRAPAGRSVSCSCVRDLIWHGRNQAMHYEDTRLEPDLNSDGKVIDRRYRSSWVETFRKLHEKNPDRFQMTHPFRSLAKDVLDALGWTDDYSKLENDMKVLLRVAATPPHG